uniref:RRM domain-containing protein n=1 Tax=Vannella robusta TaxID=1487602 RepID=A0A7S4MEE6_9EUKA|mmetsp:Transcript_19673/g.24862  ORF Transcript_19673/g.24862 Transcript_19673/m.24862 type:complete len:429 (+) Transcript_19673:83-1369(+)
MDSESLKELRKLEKPSKTLFVRNINYSTTEQDLRDIFQKYGQLEEVFTRISTRGMAFITFTTLAEAEDALRNLQGAKVRDRPIDIHYSVSREDANKQAQGSRDHSRKGTDNSLIVTLRGSDTFNSDEAREFFSTYGRVLAVRETSRRERKIIDFESSQDCKEARRLCDGMGYKDGHFNIKFANDNRRRSPRRRGRDDRRRDRDYSTPYQRRHEPGHRMSDRPMRSGVNHMIQDLASAIQHQAQGPPNYPHERPYYPPPDDRYRDYHPEYRGGPPPYYADPRDTYGPPPPHDPYYPPYWEPPRGPPGPPLDARYDDRPYYPPERGYPGPGAPGPPPGSVGPPGGYPPSHYRGGPPDPRGQGNMENLLNTLQTHRSSDPRTSRGDPRHQQASVPPVSGSPNYRPTNQTSDSKESNKNDYFNYRQASGINK